jgi:CTP:molybdopterin cytidylyltransferase MocA
MLAAVILAAGASRRMGRPKALLPVPTNEITPGKITFLDHLMTVARHPRIGATRVVLGASAEKIRSAVSLDSSVVVINPNWEQGQLTSIHAALSSLPAGSVDGMMLFLVDHPLISQKLVATLVEAFYAHQSPIVLPTFRGRRGHPVIFAARLFPELLAAPAETGARAVVWAHAAEVLQVPTEEKGVILNLNDPRALAQPTD